MYEFFKACIKNIGVKNIDVLSCQNHPEYYYLNSRQNFSTSISSDFLIEIAEGTMEWGSWNKLIFKIALKEVWSPEISSSFINSLSFDLSLERVP